MYLIRLNCFVDTFFVGFVRIGLNSSSFQHQLLMKILSRAFRVVIVIEVVFFPGQVRFFRAIGIHEDAIGQVLVDFPALLSYSMDRKIRPVVSTL